MGLSKEAAEWFCDALKGPRGDVRTTPEYQKNIGNFQKWTGKTAIRLEQWLEENKGRFAS
ncbi:hypothetical protein N7468_007584 [Penicillium chermesinum]|uniref:Uncharacterized protein n=1 Tax=Penicillium chermesinum TaxID=63820 RepID=A0A9W9NX96_9EURO|nr:uncharacterized protein N7468_007584 [Penicillium chermesinum]KAJ5226359.1 hypothetical protein N7468_007584 [Penicillium chermesinum]KAJ6160454.1 hypothetical protein N7470_003850 [Penicillium chermesinum]